MKSLRKLLFPFSIAYGAITSLRNSLYDRGSLESKTYDLPIICVGNLSTGGTGKSPMIEYLISILKTDYKLAVLSRGYKRKTTGFVEVLEKSTVMEVGDEPLQFKQKFPDISVAVCEERTKGIDVLKESSDVILLDDAFQHRKVNASLNILLTSYDDLYVDDCILPAGNLRESKKGAGRAQIIIVTKCPENISEIEMQEIREKLKPNSEQEVYFTKIGYSLEIKNSLGSKPLEYLKNKNFVLLTGIANPTPLINFLSFQDYDFEQRIFPDHHNFSSAQISELKEHNLILTTEKDYMRLKDEAGFSELYYLPIKTVFLQEGEIGFQRKIKQVVKS